MHAFCVSHRRWCQSGAVICLAHAGGRSNEEKAQVSLQRARECITVNREQIQKAVDERRGQTKSCNCCLN